MRLAARTTELACKGRAMNTFPLQMGDSVLGLEETGYPLLAAAAAAEAAMAAAMNPLTILVPA